MSSELVRIILDTLENANLEDYAVDEDSTMYSTIYSTIYSTSTLGQVKALVREAEREGFGRNCGHEHDCCGCYFLSMVFVLPLFQDQKDYFIIKEVWAQNV